MGGDNRKDRFKDLPFFSKRTDYEPWYDESADYNTNSKSYYDYLARFNYLIHKMTNFINRALDRNIIFTNTKSVNFTKKGDWISDEDTNCATYDDVIEIKAVVNISDSEENRTLINTPLKNFIISNGSVIKENGVWSPDYMPLLTEIDKELGRLQGQKGNQTEIDNINERIDNIVNEINDIKAENVILRGAIQKIVNNLHSTGAISSNNLSSFTFNSGRNIATGNINLFGGSPDGNSAIRTNSGKSENDITAGI